ncbi:MAG: TIGR04086 family membrane protein [Clostridia bacterium]|nr:TIGR04086 family membrane protein [Clostridia bacterium]
MPSLRNIPGPNTFKFHPILNGLLNSIILAIALSVILGIIFFFTPMQETMLSALSAVIIVVSVFWGGRITAKSVGSKGLLLGASVGLTFFVLTGIIAIFDGTTVTFSAIAKQLGLCLVAGALGGIFGVSEK